MRPNLCLHRQFCNSPLIAVVGIRKRLELKLAHRVDGEGLRESLRFKDCLLHLGRRVVRPAPSIGIHPFDTCTQIRQV